MGEIIKQEKKWFYGTYAAFEKTYFRIYVYLHVLKFVLYVYYMSKTVFISLQNVLFIIRERHRFRLSNYF